MEPTEAEALSLQASHVLAERAAALMRQDATLDWPAAARKAMAENAIATAGYAGDEATFAGLAAEHRARSLAADRSRNLAPRVTREVRHLNALPPAERAAAVAAALRPNRIQPATARTTIRPIRSAAELLPGETMLVKLSSAAAGGGLFAERV